MPWQRIVYDCGLLAALPVLAPLYAMKRGPTLREGVARMIRILPQRLGRLPDTLPVDPARPVLWVHAVSVGEATAARPLLKALKALCPDCQLLVSTVTETGQEVASKFEEVDGTFYLPLDLSALCLRVFEQLRPHVLVVIETEIWPGLYWSAAEAKVPVAIVNGRISDRSAARYKNLAWFFRSVFPAARLILAQTEIDRERFIAAGALPDSVRVTGNLKFDAVTPVQNVAIRRQWRQRLGLRDNDVLLAAGSTFAHEEAMLADLYLNLKAHFPALRLLIAPRHVERIQEIKNTIEGKGLSVILRSQLNEIAPAGEGVVLLDTTGELSQVYSAAEMAYLGKSLSETARGGQNPLEPAVLGVPVCFGPNMQNFKAIAEILVQGGGAAQIEHVAALQALLERWLGDPAARCTMGNNAQKTIAHHTGATARAAEAIVGLMEDR